MPGTDVERRPLNLPVQVTGRKRESEALPVAAFRSARRNRHVSVPLAVPPALWLAGEAVHAGGLTAAVAVTGAGAAGAVATWFFAPHKWTKDDGKTPRWPEVWYARATAAGIAVYMSAASFAGASSGISGEVLGAFLLAGSLAWGIPWYRHKRPRGQRKRQRELAYWQNAWEAAAPSCQLHGSHVTDAEVKPARIRLRLQLQGGKQTYGTVRAAIPAIESAFDGVTDLGMVDVRAVAGRPSQADVILRLENPLKHVVEWDASLAPRSVHDDSILGMADTGEWGRAPLRSSRFVNGRTRSGKGNDLLLLLAQLSGCPDSREVVIDLKQRAARTLLRSGAVDYVITGRDEARAYLAMLCAEISARARECDTGEEQLLATEMTPAIHTLIDETNPLTSVTAGDSECARLLAIGASTGAGLEVYYDVYTQYGALDESVRSEQVRSNLPLRVCYATEAADHGDFALGDGYRYHGPDTSKLEEKGEFYFKLGPKARPERLRAPHMPYRLFLELAGQFIAANAGRPRPLHLYCGNEPSAIAGMTWQKWWDCRFLRIDPAFRKDSPQYAAAVEEFGRPAAAAAPPGPAPAAASRQGGDVSGAEFAAALAAETSGPDLPPAPGAADAAAASAGTRLARFCSALSGARDGISPAGLVEASGMSRSWVMDKLARLASRGAVVKREQGVYAPAQGRDIRAELEAIRAGDDALLGDDGPGRLHLAYSAS